MDFVNQNHFSQRAGINNESFETDWLGSSPVFYNVATGVVDNNINSVIDFRNLEFDPEGLNNFLEFGYSVFEQTPVKNVKFLRHSSILTKNEGKLAVEYFPDSVLSQFDNYSDEKGAISLLQQSISGWEANTSGTIVIPTSGGYDSRILNHMIADKSRIASYTYGISARQHESYEVVYAKALSEALKTKWKQIELNSFHDYFLKWDDLFGASTHAHGMYQMEFYDKIVADLGFPTNLLSGIIGDAWAGSVKIPPINQPDEVSILAYSHKINASAEYSNFASSGQLKEQYFETHKYHLKHEQYRIIESMRFKIILLSYLMRVPQHAGFATWSPFLRQDVALALLNLPRERRQNRQWQLDYFTKHGIDLESRNLKIDNSNLLDRNIITFSPPDPLNTRLLKEIIKEDHLIRINKNLSSAGFFTNFMSKLMYVPKVGGLLRRMGYSDLILKDYNAYLTIKPLEYLLLKRNAA